LQRWQYQAPHLVRKLFELPGSLNLDGAAGCLDCLQAINDRAQAVIGHVGRGYRVPSGSRGRGRRLARHASGRRVGADRGLLTSADANLASDPCPRGLYSTTRPIVGAARLVERQQTLRAVGRPGRQNAVFGRIERAAAVNRNKPSVAHPHPSCPEP
jgi:hypothetical protein